MNDPKETGAAAASTIDFQEVEHLVAALEADLANLEGGSPKMQALRDEVAALRRALDDAQHDVPGQLKNVHGVLDGTIDTLEVDAVKAASYVTQIGRILGLS